MRPRLTSTSDVHWWAWAWAGALFVLYSLFSLVRHYKLGTGGFDLGIFTQALNGYSDWDIPRSDIKGWGFNLYGDHFHPILISLVPLYWLWQSASTLLVAQAALLAASSVPLARYAAERIGTGTGHAVAVAYGLSFGVQGALAFDFHEVAFAAPCLAYGLVALLETRWRAVFLWSTLLLLVKEELSLTVAAIGVLVVVRGQRRMGLTLLGIGLLSFALVVGALIPAVNPQGIYPYLTPSGAGGSLTGHSRLIQRLIELPELLVVPLEKVTLLLLLGGVTCFLSVRSPVALLCIPTIAIRFLSDSPAYWSTAFQYNLVLMPILFAAALDAQPRLIRARWKLARLLGRRAGAALLCAAAPLAPGLPLQNFILHPIEAFSRDSRVEAAHHIMAIIPDGALVEATNHLSPHLADRTRVYQWPLADRRAEWVIVDLKTPSPPRQALEDRLNRLRRDGYEQVTSKQDIVLLRLKRELLQAGS
ncbi:DUF2079 domain-containing protein [Streptomyces sp. NRRL F-2664]|uniref:DUF2079 domain-containing protein n=1 Tax=Streptomyces sp. NRRL F-2664 TaxID=1463842 RepID=UPI003B63CD82